MTTLPGTDPAMPRLGRAIRRAFATGFGAGCLPRAPGTFGTLVGVPIAWLLAGLPTAAHAAVVLVLFAVGLPLCGGLARELGRHDPREIVWDEVVGLQLALFFSARNLGPYVLGFMFFRLFDILKPPPLAGLERLPGGIGIMADDVGAGVYAALVLAMVHWWLVRTSSGV
ncbi:MAG: phosphatidylglycerophosphatase A family protein [Acidiferrobacteraceae bacterium]